MLSNEKKNALCEKIVESELFQKSPKSSALLKYLVKASIAGDFLKEDIIDLEFFGDKTIADKNSPRVRVNVYNLRKKLDEYYKKDGKEAEWKLLIDKGQYSVRFEKRSLEKKSFEKIKFKNVIPYLLLFALSIAFIFNNLKPEPPVLWQSFFENNKTTSLIIGDVFGIKGKTITGNEGWTRDFNINSVEDYYKFIEKNPELKENTKPANFKYMTGMGAVATQNMAKLFFDLKTNFDLRFYSNTSVEDLKNANIVYVGPHLNTNKITTLFNDFNPYFKIVGNQLTLSNHPKLSSKTYKTFFGEEDRDFSVISKFKGPNNNVCFIFMSNHDIGVKAAIENFTNKDFLKKFNDEQMAGKENFTAIYETYGNDRTNLGFKRMLVVPF
jgi:hypothetical protein